MVTLSKCKIMKVFAQKGNWACFKMLDMDNKSEYTAKGTVPSILSPDLIAQLTGDFVNDPKYGRQFAIKELTIINTESVTANYLRKYLTGIGPSTAQKIVDALGSNCLDKIYENPDILLTIDGIREKKLKQIKKSIKERESDEFRDLKFNVLNFFNNDITKLQLEKVVDICSQKKVNFNNIKANPYWLISHIDGFGFKKVDKLALAAGIDTYSVDRIGAAITFCLQEISMRDGHCFADMEMLTESVAQLLLNPIDKLSKREFNKFFKYLNTSDTRIDAYIEKSKVKDDLIFYKQNFDKLIKIMVDALIKDVKEECVVIDDDRIYWKEIYDSEVSVAKRVASMCKAPSVKKITKEEISSCIEEMEENEGYEFADEQKLAIEMALSKRISVITGGPGRGKTTIIKAIINGWNDDSRLVLLAPTGKAAKRMEEATTHPASTIHRYANSLKKKKNDEDNRDIGKLIIVDETSMIGIQNMQRLMYLAEYNNLVLIGDADQLASIEPGTILKDLVSAPIVPTTKLTKGFRNEGSIAYNAALINRGRSPKEYVFDDDTHFYEEDDENIVKKAVELYKYYLTFYDAPDIGVLSPMKSRGAGVDALNEAIKTAVNPNAKKVYKCGFSIGDRIMNTKNDYKRVTVDNFDNEAEGVFNGDTGVISDIDEDDETVTVYFDDEKTAEYSFDDAKYSLILAYATTIHKDQGSQHKAVILVMSTQHAFILKRNLFYTGVTRASKKLDIVGSKKAAYLAALKMDDSIRNSYLRTRIAKNI